MGGRADIVPGVVQHEVVGEVQVPTSERAMQLSRRARAMLSGGKGLNSNRTDLFHEQLTI